MANHGLKGAVYDWTGTDASLTDEACTVAGSEAQITDSSKRILNANTARAWTTANAVKLIRENLLSGKAVFDGPPGVTTVTADYLPDAQVTKVANLYEWQLSVALETAEKTAFQERWKTHLVGGAEASGSIAGYLASERWKDLIDDAVDGTRPYHLLKLFTHDPDDDETGDHFLAWAILSGLSLPITVGDVVKEDISFLCHGNVRFVPAA
jgi:hypothetical protein